MSLDQTGLVGIRLKRMNYYLIGYFSTYGNLCSFIERKTNPQYRSSWTISKTDIDSTVDVDTAKTFNKLVGSDAP